MANYFYSTDGTNIIGPLDVNALAALLRARSITRQTPCILEGQNEWGTVSDFLPDTLRPRKIEDDNSIEEPTQTHQPNSNILAALASFFIPGLGQLLQGRKVSAIIYFCLALLLWCFLLGWIIHLISCFSAAKWRK
jgi:hypothetical protein